MLQILVTGANGFIGRALVSELQRRGRLVRGAVRQGQPAAATVRIGDIDGKTDWSSALQGVGAVVHLAGRAHILRDSAADPLEEFRRVNVEGTANLARQAIDAGV